MADPWTPAWEEAVATAPAQVDIYDTLEFQHPTFDEPVRVVTDVPDDMNFTLEQGATFNSGESVTFIACSFMAEMPTFQEGKAPECKITVDNVARLLIPHLNAMIAIRADLLVVWRQYRSDDLTEPCYGPIQFNLRRVTVSGTQVTGVARIDDFANKKFPSRTYTLGDFPGLQG